MTYVKRSPGAFEIVPNAGLPTPTFYIPPGGDDGQSLVRHGPGDRMVSWRTLDKTAIGLPNVNNTSDADKPISALTAVALASKLASIDPRVLSSLRMTPGGTAVGYGAVWDFHNSNLRLRFTAENDSAGTPAITAWTIDPVTGKVVFEHDVEIKGNFVLPDGSVIGDVQTAKINAFTKTQVFDPDSPAYGLQLIGSNSSGVAMMQFKNQRADASGLGFGVSFVSGYAGWSTSTADRMVMNLAGDKHYYRGTTYLGYAEGQNFSTVPSLTVEPSLGPNGAGVMVRGGTAGSSPRIEVLSSLASENLLINPKGNGKVYVKDGTQEVVTSTAAVTLTNKSIDWANNTFTLTSAQLYSALSTKQGSGGSVVFSTGATLTGASGDSPAANDNSTRLVNSSWVRSQNYLTANQSITVSGDVTGSGTTALALTLANTGVTAGWATKVRFDAKGRALEFTTLLSSDIPTLTSSKISNFDTQVRSSRLDQMAVPTADVNLNGQRLTNLGAPQADTDAVSKAFVESLLQGLDPKGMVASASLSNLVLSGLQTVDSVVLTDGMRVLVKDQTNLAENGIYVVRAGAWERASDANTWYELSMGYTLVNSGTTNKGSGFYFSVGETGTLGTDPLTVSQFTGGTEVSAGAGLVKNGNELSVGQGTGIVVAGSTVGLTGQALALHNVTGSGFLVRTGTDTFAVRTIASPGGAITITNGNGVAGGPSISLSTALQTLGLLTPAANTLPYFTSPSSGAVADLSAYSRTNLLNLLDQAALQAVVATVPTGGTTDQVLVKTSSTNYAATWQSFTTQKVSEHSSNLYFTDTRARSAAVIDSMVGTETDQAPSARLFKFYIDAIGASINDPATGLTATKLDRVNGRAVGELVVQQNLNHVGYAASWGFRAGAFSLGITAEDDGLLSIYPQIPLIIDPATGKITFDTDVEFTGVVTGLPAGGGGELDPSVTNYFTAQQSIGTDRLLANSADRASSKAQLLLHSIDALASDNLVTVGFGSLSGRDQIYPFQFGADFALGLFGLFDSTGVAKSVSNLTFTQHYQSGTVRMGGDTDKAAAASQPALEVKPLGVRSGNSSWILVQGGDGTEPASISAEGIGATYPLYLKAKGSGEVLIDAAGIPVVGTTKTQTLTNKSIAWGNNTITLTAAQLATSISSKTGSGQLVFATNPVLNAATALNSPASNSDNLSFATTAWVVSKGYLTGNQTITVTGDLTGSGTTALNLTLADVTTSGSGARVQWDAKGRIVGVSSLLVADIPTLTSAKISDFDTQVRASRLDQMAVPTAAVDFNAQLLTNVADPINPMDAANRRYVQGLLEGLDPKGMVYLATTENITLSGVVLVDGLIVAPGQRILVKNQTNSAQNGIYVSVAGAWVRAEDANTWYELSKAYTIVSAGTDNKGKGFFFSVGETGTLDTDSLIVEQFSSVTSNTFGNGLEVASNHVTVKAHTGIAVTSDGVALTGQALAVHDLASNGFFVRTADGVVASRTIEVFGAGIGVTNKDGVSGNPTLALSSSLQAVGGLTIAADKLPYFHSGGALTTDFTAYGRSIVALANQNALRTLVGNVPTGGTAGQVLAKVDGTNYNSTWVSLTTDSVTQGTSNKYYTASAARTDLLVGDLAASATDKAPTQSAVRTAWLSLSTSLDDLEEALDDKLALTAVALGAGADLNSVMGGGFYTTGATVTNGPAADGGINANMLVMGASTTNRVAQLLINANNDTYTRVGTYSGGWTWTAWKMSGSGGGGGSLTKADVGLPNVDNTADADKPVSEPQRLAMGKVQVTGEALFNTFTPSLGMEGRDFHMNRGVANTFYIPADSEIDFDLFTVFQVTQMGVGETSISKHASVTIVGKGGYKVDGRYDSVWLKKIGANRWLIQGGVE